MAGFAGSGLSLGTLWVAIAANVDQALTELKKFGDETSKIIDEQKKKWDGLADAGKSLSSVGLALSAGLTAPLAAVGAASLKLAGDFEHSLNKIEAVTDA